MKKENSINFLQGELISNFSENIFQKHFESITNDGFKHNEEQFLIEVINQVEDIVINTWPKLIYVHDLRNDDFWKNGTYFIRKIGKKACIIDMPDLLAKTIDTQKELGAYWARNSLDEDPYLGIGKDHPLNCQRNIEDLFYYYIEYNKRYQYFIIPRIFQNEFGLFSQRIIYQPFRVSSWDFEKLEKIIKTSSNKEIRIESLDIYLEWILIPLFIQIESQISIEKTNIISGIFFKLFIQPYKIMIDSQESIIARFKKDKNILKNFEKKSLDNYQELLRIIRNIFYNYCNKKDDVHLNDIIELYKKIFIIWLKAENWDRFEEICHEMLEINDILVKNNHLGYKYKSLKLIDFISYVLLYSGQKKLFLEIISHIRDIILSSEEETKNYFKILITLGIYSNKWNKTEEKEHIIKTILLLKCDITEDEIKSIVRENSFSIYESYFLIHAIEKDNKDNIQQSDLASFIQNLYIQKIIFAHNAAKKIDLTSKLGISNKQAKKIKTLTNKKKIDKKVNKKL